MRDLTIRIAADTPAIVLKSGNRWKIGRAPACEIPIDDKSVSRYHAQIVREGGAFLIEDLGSTSGTLINGLPFGNIAALCERDVIQIGGCQLVVEAISEDAVEDPPIGGKEQNAPDDVTLVQSKDSSAEAALFQQSLRPSLGQTASTATVSVKRWPIRHGFLLGRGDDCDIVLDKPTVSRQHARVILEAGDTLLEDCHSTNGTFVNGNRLTERAPLSAGDTVNIGSLALTFDGEGLNAPDGDQGIGIKAHGLRVTVPGPEPATSISLLHDLSLNIPSGKFVGLLGISGSGKSTLMSALSGRRKPSAGTVLFENQDLYEHFELFRPQIAFVPQQVIFHEQLHVSRALFHAAKLRLPVDTSREEIQQAIDEVLGILDLDEVRRNRIAQLSGGQKKRVALGMELLTRPRVLFLDEATSGLDHATEEKMMELFGRVAGYGTTIVCITHFTDSLDHCDLIAFLVQGRLAFAGTPSELKAYFDVPVIKDVYGLAAKTLPESWASQFAESDLARQHVPREMSGSLVDSSQPTSPDAVARIRSEKPIRPSMGIPHLVRQFNVLTSRYTEVLLGDVRNVSLLLLQAPLIAVMIVLVYSNMLPMPQPEVARTTFDLSGPGSITTIANLMQASNERQSLAMVLVTSVIWCGMMSAGREIVKERSIYLHERYANLSPIAYLGSKIPPLTAICLAQTILLCAITFSMLDLGGNQLTQFAVLSATAIASMFMGLLISASLPKSDQVVAVYPVVLVAQVILSGAMVPLDGLTDVGARLFILGRWSFDAMKGTLPADRLVLEPASSLWLCFAAIGGFAIFYAALSHWVMTRSERRSNQ